MRYIITAAVVVLFVVAAIFGKRAYDERSYEDYEIEKKEAKTDSVSSYAVVDQYVVRYSADGAALIKKDLTTLWNVSFSMSDPRVDVCDGQILFYDRGGTAIHIYDKDGKIGSFEAGAPLLVARVSGKDTVATFQENGEKTDFVYYTAAGTEIAAGESTMTDPGYPFALAVSEDGINVAVSYLTAADGNTGTTIRFYSFDTTGRSKENNVTGEASYPGIFAPDIQYLSSGSCVLFRDNGFTVYRGSNAQQITKSVDFNRDIISSFHDEDNMGFIFRSSDSNHRYEMQLYTANGNLLSTSYIDHSYSKVHVGGGQVIFSSSADFTVYSMKGYLRFSGKLNEGNVSDVLKIGRDRILILTDQTMEVIKLK